MRFVQLRWVLARQYCKSHADAAKSNSIKILGKSYEADEFTNVTTHLLSFVDKKLLLRESHPLNLIKQHVCSYFFKNFIGRTGNPIFSVYDNLSPVVTVKECFDSLLVPEDHVSRNKTDTYYINREYLLRSHTTAHQAELIHMGLDNFLVFGDCYRRDEIDATHYPVFHQADGVYTLNKPQVRICEMQKNVGNEETLIFGFGNYRLKR